VIDTLYKLSGSNKQREMRKEKRERRKEKGAKSEVRKLSMKLQAAISNNDFSLFSLFISLCSFLFSLLIMRYYGQIPTHHRNFDILEQICQEKR